MTLTLTEKEKKRKKRFQKIANETRLMGQQKSSQIFIIFGTKLVHYIKQNVKKSKPKSVGQNNQI